MTLADLLEPLRARAESMADFQATLNVMWTPADQKAAILDARGLHLITDEEAELLIQVYQLETA